MTDKNINIDILKYIFTFYDIREIENLFIGFNSSIIDYLKLPRNKEILCVVIEEYLSKGYDIKCFM